MLFLCGLTCRIILYNRPCTSQRGIALPLWKPLLNQQQYPARITWRFLIRAGAAAPLSNFALTRKVVLKRRIPSAHLRSTSLLAASNFAGIHPANCSHIRSRRTPALCGVPPHDLCANYILSTDIGNRAYYLILYGVAFVKNTVFIPLNTLIFFGTLQSSQCPERIFFVEFYPGKITPEFSGSYRR